MLSSGEASFSGEASQAQSGQAGKLGQAVFLALPLRVVQSQAPLRRGRSLPSKAAQCLSAKLLSPKLSAQALQVQGAKLQAQLSKGSGQALKAQK